MTLNGFMCGAASGWTVAVVMEGLIGGTTPLLLLSVVSGALAAVGFFMAAQGEKNITQSTE